MRRTLAVRWMRALGVALALVCAAPGVPATDALHVARLSLAAAERAERGAREQLASERAAGRLSDRALEDFAAWVDRLAEDVRRQRELVAWLEDGAVAGAAPPAADPFAYDPAPTVDERISGLDSSLDASLGEFDEMLLREQRLLSERERSNSTDAGAQAGGGGGGSEGSWADGAGAEQGAEQAAAGASAAAAGEPGQQGPEDGEQSAGASGARPAQPGDGESMASATGGAHDPGGGVARGAPPDIPDGRDDDIVARQIREAAERETDPALQRKLWDEYRKYKNASR